MSDRILCGWRVRSSIELPELFPWQGGNRTVDVEILESSISEPDLPPFFVLPHSRQWANGDFLLELKGVGRFWVEGGRRVLVEPAKNATQSDLRVFLLGTVLGVLCHQRGLLPIHASAVRIGNSAVLFAGISGAGKSTLAAALGARNHALVADDISAIAPDSVRLLPAYPQRKLARDVLESLGMLEEEPVAIRTDVPKYRVSAFSGFDPQPTPLSRIYVLQSSVVKKTGEQVLLSPSESMEMLSKMIYRRGVGKKIWQPNALFTSIANLARSIPVYLLFRNEGEPLDGLVKLAEKVEAHVLERG